MADISAPWIVKLSGEDLPIKDDSFLDKASGPGYKAPNRDEKGNVLPKRTYNGYESRDGISYQSEVIGTNLNPKWKAFVLDTKISSRLSNDFIGYYEFTLAELMESYKNKTPLNLLPPPEGHKQDAGKLRVDVLMQGFPMVTATKTEAGKSMLGFWGESLINNKTPFTCKVYLFEDASEEFQKVELGSIAYLDKNTIAISAKGSKNTKDQKEPTTTALSDPGILVKTKFVVITNSHNFVVAKASLESNPAEKMSLDIDLPPELETATLVLNAETFVSRLHTAYNYARDVSKYLLNGPGIPSEAKARAKKEEFDLCEKSFNDMYPLRAFFGIEEQETPSPAAFRAALLTQAKILQTKIMDLQDPFTRQSSSSTIDNRELSNDKINIFSSKVKDLFIVADIFSQHTELKTHSQHVQGYILKKIEAGRQQGKDAAAGFGFTTAAAELQKLKLVQGSELMKLLKLENMVAAYVSELEGQIQSSIKQLQDQCYVQSPGQDPVLRFGDKAPLSNEDAGNLKHALLALSKASQIWPTDTNLGQKAEEAISTIVQALQIFCRGKMDRFSEDQNECMEDLSQVEGVMKSTPQFTRGASLLQELEDFLRQKIDEGRGIFRTALQESDPEPLKAMLNDSGLSDALRNFFIQDLLNHVHLGQNQLRDWLSSKPLPPTFDCAFVKRWNCVRYLLDSRKEVPLIGELSDKDQLSELKSPADELSAAFDEMKEGVSKAESDAKSFLLSELQGSGRSTTGISTSLEGVFATTTDAVTFLIDATNVMKQVLDIPLSVVGDAVCKVILFVTEEFKKEGSSLDLVLSSNSKSIDYDLHEAAQLLISLYRKADFLALITRTCDSDENLRQILQGQQSSISELTRDIVDAKVEKFMEENFPITLKLNENIDPSVRESTFKLIGKRVRASRNLEMLLSVYQLKREIKFCAVVEDSICRLLEDIKARCGALPSVKNVSANSPSGIEIRDQIVPKFREIDYLAANVFLVKSHVLQHLPKQIKDMENFDETAIFRERMGTLIQRVKSLQITASNLDEFATIFVYMHVHISEVLIFSELGKRMMDAGFEAFKDKFEASAKALNLIKLGSAMQNAKFLSYGRSAVQAYDVFKPNMIEVFNKKTQTQDIKYVLENLSCGGSGCSNAEKDMSAVDKAFTQVNEEFLKNLDNSVKNGFAAQCESSLIESIIAFGEKMKNNTDLIMNANGGEWKAGTREKVTELVGKILALWTLQQSSRFLRSLDSESKKSYLCRPHPVQIVAILCLLGLGPLKKSAPVIERSLIQVRTGEGKTLVMGIAACVFALLGVDVSCACYSEYLSQRDYEYMLPLFRALGIEDGQKDPKAGIVSYYTLVKLCETEINKRCNIRQKVRDLITGASSSASGSAARTSPARILLVDEVDVFFSEDFYGRPYSPACDFTDNGVIDLLREIWNKRSAQPTPSEVKDWDVYKRLIKRFPEWDFLLEASMTHILADLRSFPNDQYQVTNGRIGYKEMDTVVYNVRKGYKTMFAYLKEEEAGTITTEDVVRNLGMLIKCGTFLFAKFPNRFNLVSGVTGTLESLGVAEKSLIEDEYKIRNFYFMPSAYGQMRLEDKGIELTHSHFDEICSSIKDNIVGRAVLVFFRDYQQLTKFMKSSELKAAFEDPTLKTENIEGRSIIILCEETPKDNKEQIVSSRAACPNALTLATRPFGRGTDFISMDPEVNANKGIHVIQTFLSESEAEEVQIRGRTARQGDNGTYSLVLDIQDVVTTLQFANEQELTGDKSTTIKDKLQSQRSKAFAGKFEKLKEFVKAASDDDEKAWQFVDQLVKNDMTTVKRVIQELNQPVPITRILMAVDATGSMDGMMDQLKQNLEAMFSRAKEILEKEMKDNPSAQFEMQLVGFRNYASGKTMLLERSSWVRDPAELINFLQKLTAKGGQGNEAIEVAFQYATTQRDLSHIILIGDAPPNTDAEVQQKRANSPVWSNQIGYDATVNINHWKGTEFEQPTTWQVQLEELKKRKISIDAHYLLPRAKNDFIKIAKETGGDAQDIEQNYKNKEFLIALITKSILLQVGGEKLGKQLIKAYENQSYV